MEPLKSIGIVGGLGPYAGLQLARSILDKTRVMREQEHYPLAMLSYPGLIHDRTEFLLGTGVENPAHGIVKVLHQLESLGAVVAGIACNTSHAPQIHEVIESELLRGQSQVRLLSIVDETINVLLNDTGRGRLGILTTNGTYYAEVYSKPLSELGIELVIPSKEMQCLIHDLIYNPLYGIKLNKGIYSKAFREKLYVVIQYFRKAHANSLLLGCTELSIIDHFFTENRFKCYDTTEIYAEALIREFNEEVLREGVYQNLMDKEDRI